VLLEVPHNKVVNSTYNFPQQTKIDASIMANEKRNVTFSCITIREFSPIIGESPTCSSGVPIALGDECIRVSTYSVTDFERFRGNSRRNRNELILSARERASILMEEGYDRMELLNAESRTNQARRAILECMMNVDQEKHQERLEKATKILSKMRVWRPTKAPSLLPDKVEEGARCA
jgi:hypothetical protein